MIRDLGFFRGAAVSILSIPAFCVLVVAVAILMLVGAVMLVAAALFAPAYFLIRTSGLTLEEVEEEEEKLIYCPNCRFVWDPETDPDGMDRCTHCGAELGVLIFKP